jgi:hypothetical protein
MGPRKRLNVLGKIKISCPYQHSNPETFSQQAAYSYTEHANPASFEGQVLDVIILLRDRSFFCCFTMDRKLGWPGQKGWYVIKRRVTTSLFQK